MLALDERIGRPGKQRIELATRDLEIAARAMPVLEASHRNPTEACALALVAGEQRRGQSLGRGVARATVARPSSSARWVAISAKRTSIGSIVSIRERMSSSRCERWAATTLASA